MNIPKICSDETERHKSYQRVIKLLDIDSVLFQKVVKVIDTNYDGKISKRELSDLFFTTGQISPFQEPSGSDT